MQTVYILEFLFLTISCLVCITLDVPRHAPRVIKLTYEGEGPIDTTLMLVGKVNAAFLQPVANIPLLGFVRILL